MKWRRKAAIAMVALVGCEAGGVTQVPRDPTRLEIAFPDSVEFQESVTATAVAVDAEGEVLPDAPIEWFSPDERVITVSSTGVLTGIHPGVGMLIARIGSVTDTARISVVTSSCVPPIGLIDVPGNAFYGSVVRAGSIEHGYEYGTPSYNGVPTLHGAGVAFGVRPDTVLIGYHYAGGRGSDFEHLTSAVCRTNLAPMHTISRLQLSAMRRPMPSSTPDLVVVQEQFAYGNEEDHGYVLFRYEFTNTGTSSIPELYVGFTSDFDIYSTQNVGGYDSGTQTAYVISPDSTNQEVVGGTTLIGSELHTYSTIPDRNSFWSRTEYFDLISQGMSPPGPTGIHDVKHVLAPPPLTLEPGETEDVWFALVVGANRGELVQSVEAAARKVEALR